MIKRNDKPFDKSKKQENYYRVVFTETFDVVVLATDEKQAKKQFNLGNYYTDMSLTGVEITNIYEIKPYVELTESKE